MPVFKDFSENGKLLSTREESLNGANLTRYTNENGLEQLQGYKDALNDLLKDLVQVLHYDSNGSLLPDSPSCVRTKLKKLFEERQSFSNSLNKFISQSQASNSSNDFDTKLEL